MIIKTRGLNGQTVFIRDDKRKEMPAVNCLTNQDNNCAETMKKLLKNLDIGRVVKKISETHSQDKTRIMRILMKSYFRKQSKTKQKMEMKFKLNHFFKIL